MTDKQKPTAAGAPEGEVATNGGEYVTRDEVKRVCTELGLRDWSALKEPEVTEAEAATILKAVNVKGMPVPVNAFRKGLEVELEHGIRYDDANVTNNHPLLTGKIVLAHLKETTDYYERLAVAEIESDLLKAVLSQDSKKIEAKYRELISAQHQLNQAVSAQFR
ncbi:MAG: DUF5661 family protein [Halobacteriota archaeon]